MEPVIVTLAEPVIEALTVVLAEGLLEGDEEALDEPVIEVLGEHVIEGLIVELMLGLLEVVWVRDFVGVSVFVVVAVWL